MQKSPEDIFSSSFPSLSLSKSVALMMIMENLSLRKAL